MEQFVAESYIRLFERKLQSCSRPEERKVLSDLLEAERQRLHEIRARFRSAHRKGERAPSPRRA